MRPARLAACRSRTSGRACRVPAGQEVREDGSRDGTRIDLVLGANHPLAQRCYFHLPEFVHGLDGGGEGRHLAPRRLLGVSARDGDYESGIDVRSIRPHGVLTAIARAHRGREPVSRAKTTIRWAAE